MRSLVLVLALGACSGDTPKSVDAIPACTKAVYDHCNTEHDCAGACQFFSAALEVCTQPCSPTNACPTDSTGVAGMCVDMGGGVMVCKPAAPNMCHL